MTVPEFTYHRPRSQAELWRLFAATDAPIVLMAGGTDVVPALKRGLTTPAALVDIKRLPELQGVTATSDGGMRLGAAVTLHALARSSQVADAWPSLAEAAGTVASYQIRNRGTLGGNLCLDTRCAYFNQSAFWRAEYPDCRKTGGRSCYVAPKSDRCNALSSSDLAPLLIALGAQVETVSPTQAGVSALEELYSDNGLHAHTLARGEVVLSVLLPSSAGIRASYRRYSTRETVDFPMLSVAGAVGAGGQTRIVVGHVASRPLRTPLAEEELAALLDGSGGDPSSIAETAANELHLVSGVRGSVTYKRRVLRGLVAEVVAELSATDGTGA